MRETNRQRSLELAELRKKFHHWRKTRVRRGTVPKDFMLQAVRLAKSLGVNRVAKSLGLDYNKLKVASGQRLSHQEPTPIKSAGFTELSLRPDPPFSCRIEWVKESGKMIIHLNDPTGDHLEKIASQFQESP